jgi:AhpC/TSA family
MGWGKVRFQIALLAMVVVSFGFASSQDSVVDLDGRPVNPFTWSHGKPVVLVFLRRDCPVSGRYAPTIQRISDEFAQRASFWLVYPDKSEAPDNIRKSVAEFRYKLPVLRDPKHELVGLAHVQITPEVAVFDSNRRLIYDGRIDDWYIDLSRARSVPTTHELEDAIRAVAERRTVARSEVRGVGCYISDLE